MAARVLSLAKPPRDYLPEMDICKTGLISGSLPEFWSRQGSGLSNTPDISSLITYITKGYHYTNTTEEELDL